MRLLKLDENQFEVIKHALSIVARGSSDSEKASTAQGLLDEWKLEEQENKAHAERLSNGPDHPFNCEPLARRGAFG